MGAILGVREEGGLRLGGTLDTWNGEFLMKEISGVSGMERYGRRGLGTRDGDGGP